MASALAAAGATAVVGDLDTEPVLDVTDRSGYRAFLAAVEDLHGPVDILVNNAGVMWVGPFDEEPAEAARRQFDVNVHGMITGCKLVAPGMALRGRGHIVTIASAASRIAPAGEATYAATKHAVYGYSNALRAELRGSGVHVSVVMPSVVETELARGTANGSVRRLRPSEVADAVVRLLRRPAFEVYVPRRLTVVDKVLGVLPGRVRLAAHDALVPDQRARTDHAARASYQHRLGEKEGRPVNGKRGKGTPS